MIDFLSEDLEAKQEVPHQVVRLRTQVWSNAAGLHVKRSLTFLKKKSGECRLLENDLDAIGAEEVFGRILNFSSCKDGLYHIQVCNEERDWETGIIEDWDLVLMNYEEG